MSRSDQASAALAACDHVKGARDQIKRMSCCMQVAPWQVMAQPQTPPPPPHHPQSSLWGRARERSIAALQVVRIYNMKGDFAAPAPSLRRLPLSGVPLGAAFWGDDSTAGACIEGVGEVAAMVTAAVPPGQNRVAETTLLSAIHGAAPATAVCAAATSGGGRPVMATMTAKNKVAVMLGGGKKVAEVEPNGIENYQVRLPLRLSDGHDATESLFVCACAARACLPDRKAAAAQAWRKPRTAPACARSAVVLAASPCEAAVRSADCAVA